MERREFIKAFAATGLAFLPGVAHSQSLRIRRSINDLDLNDPIVETFRLGVERMHALDSSDERSWAAQARIHLDHCHRQPDHFLPWHRAYLHFFEEIIRDLTGEESWAVPYWDWAAYPQVPPHFWGPSERLDPRRWNDPDSQVGNGQRRRGPNDVVSITQPEIDRILRNGNYFIFSNRLDGGPHGRVHNFIGGHMRAFLSPLDPVFWSHHANVDRIWEQWLSNPLNSNPGDTGWLDESFDDVFSDRTGVLVQPLQSRNVLNSFELGYAYDDVPLRIRPAGEVPFIASPQVDPFEEPVVSASNGIPNQVGIPVPIRLELSDQIRIDPSFTDVEAARSGQVRRRILARLSDVSVPADAQGYEIRVFLNCPYLQESTPKDDPHFVDDVSLFSLRDMTMPDGSPMIVLDRQVIVDLTDAMVALNARRTPAIDTADIQIIGVRDGLDDVVSDEFSFGRAEIAVLEA